MLMVRPLDDRHLNWLNRYGRDGRLHSKIRMSGDDYPDCVHPGPNRRFYKRRLNRQLRRRGKIDTRQRLKEAFEDA